MHRFLEEAGYSEAERVRLQGDASTRIYERVTQKDRHAILMIAPRRPDGPPIRDGLSYSAIAHLAEDVVPFVALARALRERGISTPEIRAADLGEGLVILEDLGSEPIVGGNPPAPLDDRYAAALEVLAGAASRRAAGHAAGRAQRQLPAAALRSRRADDRGAIAVRLVPSAAAGDAHAGRAG